MMDYSKNINNKIEGIERTLKSMAQDVNTFRKEQAEYNKSAIIYLAAIAFLGMTLNCGISGCLARDIVDNMREKPLPVYNVPAPKYK